MHSIVTTFRGAVIKVEVANFYAVMDTLIDQDVYHIDFTHSICHCIQTSKYTHRGNKLLDAMRLLLQDAMCVLQQCSLSLVSSAPKK